MIARNDGQLGLEEDDIDDILYLVRTNDRDELDGLLSTLSQKYTASESAVLQSSVADGSGNTAVHFAAANGLTDLLKHILDILQLSQSSDFVNKRNQSGNTALHWSSLNGHLATTTALVEAGADIWLRNSAGNLAVFEAERAGKDDIVAYLLKVGGTEKETEGEINAGDGAVEASMSMDETVEATSEDLAATDLNR
ncbi:Ankyrin repeat-containing protein [Sphaceloma murrayae]|uniref:Ankyrin repeat-containing protein n=1 Tax=Sphaceloma murrayae TaxID=2082308 RepID=A0A2K1R1N0_9PEZI|nr:Ankyrin repeat-containing protein [Sphaceloma murrayae]